MKISRIGSDKGTVSTVLLDRSPDSVVALGSSSLMFRFERVRLRYEPPTHHDYTVVLSREDLDKIKIALGRGTA